MIIENAQEEKKLEQEEQPTELFATVSAVHAHGVQIQLDGESEPGEKHYKVIQSYLPKVGDYVLVLKIGGSYLIIGSKGAPIAAVKYATLDANNRVVEVANNALNATNAAKATNATNATNAETAKNYTGQHNGDRVGFFGFQGYGRQDVGTLSTSANLFQTISKLNLLIECLSRYNLIR